MIYFCFELINTVLHETMNQRNVEVIDNTTNTTSPFLYFVQENNVLNLINIYQMQSPSSLPCILGQITLFEFKSSIIISVSHTKLNGIRNDLPDDCLTYYLGQQWKYREHDLPLGS